MYRITFVFSLLPFALCLVAQEASAPDRVTVPFSDPARPRTVRVSVLNGGITVKGYDGKDVIVESHGRVSSAPRRRERATPPAAEGLRRIENTSSSLDIEEENNVVRISGGITRSVELLIQVPVNTSLNLRSTNNGNIVVENVNGEIDVNNLNGNVTLTNVSGSVLAHSLNGRVQVSLDRVTADKPMSFSTLNGDIDVTLPPDVKARVKMKTDNGDIYTDFDIKLEAGKPPLVEDTRSKGGKYRVRLDKAMYGSINGGGPEMQFTTFNGKILIRKKK